MGPIIILGVFGILIVLLSLPIILKKGPDPFEKIKGGGLATGFGPGQSSTAEREKLRYNSGKFSLKKFEKHLVPKDAKELSASKLKLMRAGYRKDDAVGNYNFAKMALGIVGLMGGLIYTMLFAGDMSTTNVFLYILMPGGIGYYLPSYWIERKVQTREEELENGFPDALDLMLVCVEAGQSLDQSILRVSVEIKHANKALAEEFGIVADELRAGKDRITVLRDLGIRCGIPDISSFVTVLVQSANFGTSISDALRVYAFEMRDKRIMRAEEKANKLPTKMTLATMMFTVPPLLIIMVGPSVYDIYVNLVLD